MIPIYIFITITIICVIIFTILKEVGPFFISLLTGSVIIGVLCLASYTKAGQTYSYERMTQWYKSIQYDIQQGNEINIKDIYTYNREIELTQKYINSKWCGIYWDERIAEMPLIEMEVVK